MQSKEEHSESWLDQEKRIMVYCKKMAVGWKLLKKIPLVTFRTKGTCYNKKQVKIGWDFLNSDHKLSRDILHNSKDKPSVLKKCQILYKIYC